MRGVLYASTGRIDGRFDDRLADRSLQFVGIGLRLCAVEIKVHAWLFNTIKVLKISEGDQLAVAKAVGLIGS